MTNDPRVQRVLLELRESVAVATEHAYRQLVDLRIEAPAEPSAAIPLSGEERTALATLKLLRERGVIGQ